MGQLKIKKKSKISVYYWNEEHILYKLDIERNIQTFSWFFYIVFIYDLKLLTWTMLKYIRHQFCSRQIFYESIDIWVYRIHKTSTNQCTNDNSCNNNDEL